MNLYIKKNYLISLTEPIYLFFLLLFIIFLSRYFYPYGYEPDFWIRAPNYVLNTKETWNPIDFGFDDNIRNILSFIFQKLSVVSNCNSSLESFKDHLIGKQNVNTPMGIWQIIDHYTCTQNFNQILLRLSLYAILFSPFWFFLIFLSYFKKHETKVFDNTLSICISLFFPSMIFYTGVLSKEQIVLLFSLFLILFRHSPISIFFLIIIILIDFGNGFFVSIFYFGNILLKLLFIYTNILIYISILIFSCLLAYLISTDILYFINLYFENYLPAFLNIFIDGILDHHYVDGFSDKYPLFFRPIITFMSFNYFTPGNIKVIPLYLLSFVYLIILFYNCIFVKLSKSNSINRKKLIMKILEVVNIFAIILITVFILPAYCNAKYYIFLLPILFSLALEIYSYHKIIIFNIFANLIVLINLAMYRI